MADQPNMNRINCYLTNGILDNKQQLNIGQPFCIKFQVHQYILNIQLKLPLCLNKNLDTTNKNVLISRDYLFSFLPGQDHVSVIPAPDSSRFYYSEFIFSSDKYFFYEKFYLFFFQFVFLLTLQKACWIGRNPFLSYTHHFC